AHPPRPAAKTAATMYLRCRGECSPDIQSVSRAGKPRTIWRQDLVICRAGSGIPVSAAAVGSDYWLNRPPLGSPAEATGNNRLAGYHVPVTAIAGADRRVPGQR